MNQRYLPPLICIFNLGKQINYMVGFSEIVLYVVIFCRDTKFYKLVLKYPGLLKKAMYSSFYFHNKKRSRHLGHNTPNIGNIYGYTPFNFPSLVVGNVILVQI